jgi:hypothetical protein
MPRSDRRRTARTVLRVAVVCSTATCALAPAAWAQTVPASVRACTLETDSLKRLICFDKEVARYTGQPAGDPKQGAPASPSSRETASPPVAKTMSPPPPREDGDDSRDQPAATPPSPGKPRHIAARIVRIEPFPDAIVVHLDNDQVWEQVQEAAADVNLHTGDTVSIDREMGSYWLSGTGGSAMKVKRKK